MDWLQKKLKRILYKKMFLDKDITMAIKDGAVERVMKIVPDHSKDIFINKLKSVKPEILK